MLDCGRKADNSDLHEHVKLAEKFFEEDATFTRGKAVQRMRDAESEISVVPTSSYLPSSQMQL